MAFDLTSDAKAKLEQVNLSTQIIVEIEGIPYVFGAQVVGEFARIGAEGLLINGFDIGGNVPVQNQRDWISIDGTTTTLSQQLKQDLSTSSVTTMNVALLNVGEQLSTWFAPGGLVDDVLARKCDVFLTLDGLAHPEDSIRIFSGIISSMTFKAGVAVVQVSHPEQLKRQKIFPEFKTQVFKTDGTIGSNLTGGINESTTSIPVSDGSVFTASTVTDFRFIEIGSEKMKVTNVAGNNLTVVRAQLNTGASAHSSSDEVVEVYGVGKDESVIKVTDLTNFLPSDGIVKTYVTINDEAMEVTNAQNIFDGSTLLYGLLTVLRGQFSTTKFFHESEDDVESVYRVQDKGIDAALKILLSNGGTPYLTNISVPKFEQITSVVNQDNAFALQRDPQKEYGLVKGDKVTITGASVSANNVTNAVIQGFGFEDPFYYVFIDQNLSSETESSAVASFTSQFNVLGKDFALKLDPTQVDVEQHLKIRNNFINSHPDLDLIIREQTDGQELINRLIYRPYSIYPIPRKGKVSCNITSPPLAESDTKFIKIDNVLNPDSLQIQRNINEFFYNAIIYKYSPDIIEDDLKAGFILKSEESENRIPVGNRPLVIEARAFRRTDAVLNYIRDVSLKFLDRYKFSAEYINVNTMYSVGMPIDIGDTVILQGDDLKIVDTKNPGKVFQDRVMEVTGKRLNIKSGVVSLTLTDTVFSADARFGVISPSSKVKANATTTNIPLKISYASLINVDEREKWINYLNKNVKIRNADYSYNQDTIIRGIDTDLNMTVDALSSPPGEDFIVQIPDYAQDNTATDGSYKGRFVFFNPSVSVVSAASETEVTVSGSDIGKFVVGQFVKVFKSDFSNTSQDIKITQINSNTITLESAIGFTPTSGDKIEKIGFQDGGTYYALV